MLRIKMRYTIPRIYRNILVWTMYIVYFPLHPAGIRHMYKPSQSPTHYFYFIFINNMGRGVGVGRVYQWSTGTLCESTNLSKLYLAAATPLAGFFGPCTGAGASKREGGGCCPSWNKINIYTPKLYFHFLFPPVWFFLFCYEQTVNILIQTKPIRN